MRADTLYAAWRHFTSLISRRDMRMSASAVFDVMMRPLPRHPPQIAATMRAHAPLRAVCQSLFRGVYAFDATPPCHAMMLLCCCHI